MKQDRTVRYWRLADVKAAAGLAVTADDDRLVRARDVRKLHGDISDMTLWRRIRDEKIPQPVIGPTASQK